MVGGMQGVQLNAVDGAGNTALMDAIRHSHKEVQAALRTAGANLAAVNVADKLCLAAAEDDTPFLEVRLMPPFPCLPQLPARLALPNHKPLPNPSALPPCSPLALLPALPSA